jgi:DNA primase
MEVEDVLSRVDILKYVSQYVELEEENGEWFGLCPWHQENTPSFSVSPDKGTYGLVYCFGCHKGGNVLNFVQKYHNLGFKDALKHLCSYAGITEDQLPQRLTATSVIKKYRTPNKKQKESTYKILDSDIMNRYERNPEKLTAWVEEGISPEVLEKYQVRYDPLSNRIMYPIRTTYGEFMNIDGRTLDPDWKEKKIRKYTHFHKTGIMDTIYALWENRDAIVKAKEILLFEGAKSVYKCETWGIMNAAALLGGHLNPSQRKILMSLSKQGVRVVFALDYEVNKETGKAVSVLDDDEVKALCRYMPIETIVNWNNLLQLKMAPVDLGKETWDILYERRKRIN